MKIIGVHAYRITCLSCLLHFLIKDYMLWADNNNVLPDNSLGFRKGARTEDKLFILTSLLNKYAKKGASVCLFCRLHKIL